MRFPTNNYAKGGNILHVALIDTGLGPAYRRDINASSRAMPRLLLLLRGALVEQPLEVGPHARMRLVLAGQPALHAATG